MSFNNKNLNCSEVITAHIDVTFNIFTEPYMVEILNMVCVKKFENTFCEL